MGNFLVKPPEKKKKTREDLINRFRCWVENEKSVTAPLPEKRRLVIVFANLCNALQSSETLDEKLMYVLTLLHELTPEIENNTPIKRFLEVERFTDVCVGVSNYLQVGIFVLDKNFAQTFEQPPKKTGRLQYARDFLSLLSPNGSSIDTQRNGRSTPRTPDQEVPAEDHLSEEYLSQFIDQATRFYDRIPFNEESLVTDADEEQPTVAPLHDITLQEELPMTNGFGGEVFENVESMSLDEMPYAEQIGDEDITIGHESTDRMRLTRTADEIRGDTSHELSNWMAEEQSVDVAQLPSPTPSFILEPLVVPPKAVRRRRQKKQPVRDRAIDLPTQAPDERIDLSEHRREWLKEWTKQSLGWQSANDLLRSASNFVVHGRERGAFLKKLQRLPSGRNRRRLTSVPPVTSPYFPADSTHSEDSVLRGFTPEQSWGGPSARTSLHPQQSGLEREPSVSDAGGAWGPEPLSPTEGTEASIADLGHRSLSEVGHVSPSSTREDEEKEMTPDQSSDSSEQAENYYKDLIRLMRTHARYTEQKGKRLPYITVGELPELGLCSEVELNVVFMHLLKFVDKKKIFLYQRGAQLSAQSQELPRRNGIPEQIFIFLR